MNTTSIKHLGLGVALAAGFASSANASFTSVVLDDGRTSIGTVATAPAGTQLATVTSPFFAANMAWSGSLVTTVSTYNAAGDILIAYTLSNNGTTLGHTDGTIEELEVNLYTYATGVTAGASKAGASASLDSGPAGFGGDIMTFDFSLKAGQTETFYVETTDTHYWGSEATVQDGSFAGPIPTFSPVPEPSTIIAGALMVLPFGASALRIVRRKQAV